MSQICKRHTRLLSLLQWMIHLASWPVFHSYGVLLSPDSLSGTLRRAF